MIVVRAIEEVTKIFEKAPMELVLPIPTVLMLAVFLVKYVNPYVVELKFIL